jgi:hypothetical protein
MRRRAASLLLLLGLPVLAGCASTAPHSAAAAAINSGIAVGAGAASRSAGGCWAICTDGLVCNPGTGWCEKPKPTVAADCPPGAAANDLRCRPWPAHTVVSPAPAGTGVIGVSPATGTTPPPPAEASPGGPPRP